MPILLAVAPTEPKQKIREKDIMWWYIVTYFLTIETNKNIRRAYEQIVGTTALLF